MRRLLVFLLCLLTAPAFAEERPFTSPVQGTRVWLDATAWPRADATVFAFGVNGQIQLRPGLMIDLQVPFAAGQIVGESSPHAAPGNVLPGLHLAFPFGGFLVVWVGVQFAIPTIYDVGTTNDSLATTSLATLAAVSTNALDLFRFLPEYFAVNPRVGIDLRLGERATLRTELSGSIGLPSGADAQSSQSTPVEIQLWAELEIGLPGSFVTGVRATGALIALGWPISSEGCGVFFGYAPEKGFEARLSGLVATEPPLANGYGHVGGATASIAAQAGYRF